MFWTTVKMVNFVSARPLNSCAFSTSCNDMGSDHVTLLQHTEERWLSRGKILTCFIELRDELKVLYTDHNVDLSDRLNDDEFLTRLAYLGDVFYHKNDLNLGLQGLSTTIFKVWDTIGAMIKKLELFFVSINKDNTQVFPSLYDFLCANELKLMDNEIIGRLNSLGFSNDCIAWFTNYFSDRVQCIKSEGLLSGPPAVSMGVAQGSIFGPTLFSVYINDVALAAGDTLINLYADDTILYTSGPFLDTV
jgi:hypothetical protein